MTKDPRSSIRPVERPAGAGTGEKVRSAVHRKLIATALVVLGLGGVVACGGDGSQQRATTPWHPNETAPTVSQRWWWQPVERACEDDSDCRRGERCSRMRLSSCPTCPPGEVAELCIARDSGGARAQR